MDPFKILHEDVYSMIFQHLRVRDIIKCSLVSKLWHDVIGNEHECMKKIWLRFYEPLDDLQSLMESSRKYENFKVQGDLSKSLLPVFNKYKWRKVLMRDNTNMNPEDYYEFLFGLAPSIEELELWDCSTKDRKDIEPINFTRLKKLKVNLSNRYSFAIFLGKNVRLRNIVLMDVSMKFPNAINDFLEAPNPIIQLLRKNPQIKSLHLVGVEKIFCEDLTANGTESETKLDLRSFHMWADLKSLDTFERENFIKFIETQKNLESISINSEMK